MLLRSYPRLLVLALALPEMSHALGLGNMRVDSKLGEPLSAQIEILGATPDELKAVKASVASPELFARYHAERPTFLASASITVGTDAAGKPVLNVQSSEAFSEPLVEFLIDLHCGKAELVRDYSLLLDPAHSTPSLSANAPAGPNAETSPPIEESVAEVPQIVLPSNVLISVATPKIVQAQVSATVKVGTQYRVVAHDTLRDISRHMGARSEAEQHRMMLAIFRTNQQAFAGNINLLHSGALINIPAPADIEIFDSADVEREIRAQMSAWRRDPRLASRQVITLPLIAKSGPAVVSAPVAPSADVSAVVSTVNSLDDRVKYLQQSLAETNRQLAIASAWVNDMERAKTVIPPVTATAVAVQAQSITGRTSLSALLMTLAFLGGAVIYACRRFLSRAYAPRKAVRAEEPTIEVPVLDDIALSAASSAFYANASYTVAESVREPVAAPPTARRDLPVSAEASDSQASLEMTQVVDIDVDSTQARDTGYAVEPDTVVLDTLEPKAVDAVGTVLDYNLSDLDGRAQHVEMPGSLHEHVVVVERRKNVVDTLMAAIQRDPTRYDLRMKLLETLYSAASTNLRAFKEVVRDLARHPEKLKAGEWDQIVAMRRHIAADDALFADRPTEQKVADCA